MRNIHAVKVLAMNDRGRQYLKHLKTAFPERQYITNINKSNAHSSTNEIKATHIQCNKRATTNRFQHACHTAISLTNENSILGL